MSPRIFNLLRAMPAIIAMLLCFGLPSRATAARVMLPGFPLLKQQHTLTCESSAVSMATRGLITEGQLMAAMPRNPNPNLGFRGSPDGFQGNALIDYGVYAAPLRAALLRYGFQSDVILYGNNNLLASYVARGWPVVVWVTYKLQPARPRLAQYGGVHFTLVPHEHALMLVGYDRYTLFAHDPWNGGLVRYRWNQFDRSWGYFGNMALAIQPCAAPQPVQWIHTTTTSTSEIKWTWSKALNVSQFRVLVVRHGKHDTTVFQGDLPVRHVSIPNPQSGALYEISVQSLSACGYTSDPVRLLTQVIGPLPTSTPTPRATPSPTGTPVAESTTTTTPVPATATATATGTRAAP